MTGVAGHAALLILGSYHFLVALDALTGARVWTQSLPVQVAGACGNGGLAGTVAYDASLGAVFVASGNGLAANHVVLYELSAASGNVLGSVDVTPTLVGTEAVTAHTAITLVNGVAYVGVGSACEGLPTSPPWRGSVVAVNVATMTVAQRFYSAWRQGGQYSGGGVWGWGGVSADGAGDVYVGTGNAETPDTAGGATPPPPFVAAQSESVGFAEHLVKLTSALGVVDSNAPPFNFQIGYADLDYAGTPVLFQPPLGSGCGDLLVATQGKGGTLVVNDTTALNPPIASYALSVPSGAAYGIGNPAYSPATGLLYGAINSAGPGSSLLPPGLAAIGGCGSQIVWNAQFGPDATAYTSSVNPRSAPTVTAGGVVFLGTPCTSDGNGGCTTPGVLNGALWAVDATSGAVLGSGKPVLVTTDAIRMAPSADGLWLWITDISGNVYALTVDSHVPVAVHRPGIRSVPKIRYGR